MTLDMRYVLTSVSSPQSWWIYCLSHCYAICMGQIIKSVIVCVCLCLSVCLSVDTPTVAFFNQSSRNLARTFGAVSYTHLTLPTIYSV